MPATSSKNAEAEGESAGPVTAATDRLLATTSTFDAEALTASSLCAGWTRAHVLAHLARNADALTNLLTWARTGTENFMYPSKEQRDADIETGASQPLDDLIDDLKRASDRFASAVTELPAAAWQQEVRMGPGGSGPTIPARRTLWARLQELEVHHVDLDAGYAPDDWPDMFVRRALAETIRGFGQRDDVPDVTLAIDGTTARIGNGGHVTVKGPPRQILAWLIGRSSGERLETTPAQPLPRLPQWK
ncbi:maleylpyruvate isomerase family mycothiol-dependent enzyme [Phytoactinopolyspora halophila]|uniref:maleylpyruvate isomerase family mycothiol-dependent enzyme n=1 Tax=Phytoactinopolyspora halophila TaxID=1981511 RepID=UPI001B8D17D6|nr:maleylpyruvate isomerase family mycothiol-dependent enzyme [Phytoactinopolyspora halophila]